MNKVIIYTDGACSGNPGPGGWGAVLLAGGARKELGGGEKHTTNNRMELMAAIKALEALRFSCEVELYSDSSYLVDAHNKGWLQSWAKKGFVRGKEKTPVPNTDLWQRLLQLEQLHHIRWNKVSGHAGVEENERCDEIAVQQSRLAAEG